MFFADNERVHAFLYFAATASCTVVCLRLFDVEKKEQWLYAQLSMSLDAVITHTQFANALLRMQCSGFSSMDSVCHRGYPNECGWKDKCGTVSPVCVCVCVCPECCTFEGYNIAYLYANAQAKNLT